MQAVHVLAYEQWVGPIPKGYQVDHVCHNQDKTCIGGNSCRHRRCINPDHLEAVTGYENSKRGWSFQSLARFQKAKTHCPTGHALSGNNLYIEPRGSRQCRACRKLQFQQYIKRKKESMPWLPPTGQQE